MFRNNIRFLLLILSLSIFQLIINSSTIFYIDCLGVILIILLFKKNISLRIIILLSFFTDLMGHWYIGSHLFAVIIISFFTQNLFTMYAMGSSIQRTFMISIFYALLSGIISLIGILTHSGFINWLDFGLEVILLCPLIQWLFSFATKRRPKADLIF